MTLFGPGAPGTLRALSAAALAAALALAPRPGAATTDRDQPVGRALDELAAAYRAKDAPRFLKLADPAFEGGLAALADALRRDFDAYASVELQVSDLATSEPAPEAGGLPRYAAAFKYALTGVSAAGEKRLDTGRSEFYFVFPDTATALPVLIGIKKPWPFGIAPVPPVSPAPPPPAPPQPAPPRVGPSVDELKDAARESFDRLVSAYNRRNAGSFMNLVSSRFVGEELEASLNKDFDACVQVFLEARPRTPVVYKDHTQVSIEFAYTFYYGDATGGAGLSGFDFIIEDRKARLYAVHSPLFGRVPSKVQEQAAEASLAGLARAYSERDRRGFMSLISENDFLGDRSTLDDAIRRDFQTYRDIKMQIIPDSFLAERDRVIARFHYNLTVTDTQGDQVFSGAPEFKFKCEKGAARLYAMSKPIIFGNSLPQSENPIDGGQGTSAGTSGTAGGEANAGGAKAGGDATLPRHGIFGLTEGFVFGTGQSVTDAFTGDVFAAQGVCDPGNCILQAAFGIQKIPACTLMSVGCIAQPSSETASAVLGDCYAITTAENKFVVIKLTNLPAGNGPAAVKRVKPAQINDFVFDYRGPQDGLCFP